MIRKTVACYSHSWHYRERIILFLENNLVQKLYREKKTTVLQDVVDGRHGMHESCP
jgi:hypothetical protein